MLRVYALLLGLAGAAPCGSQDMVAEAGGGTWPRDPHTTRLFLAPTARTLAAGEAQIGVFEVVMPFASYGITNGITVSGGLTALPGEHFGELAHLAAQVRLVDRPTTQLSVGGYGIFGVEEVDATGIGFAVGTFGGRDDAVTLGVATPFYRDGADGDFGSRLLVL